MKRRICIGLVQKSAAWEQLLTQIGCAFELVDFNQELLASYSLIVANDSVNDRQLLSLQSYIEQGGAVVDQMGQNLFPHCDRSSVYHQFILSDDPSFGVPFIDFYENLGRLKNADSWDHTIHIDAMDSGFRVFLGWPIDKLYSDEKFIRKKFHDPNEVLPDEIVNRKSRHYLRRAIESLFIQLHHLCGLPLVCRGNTPEVNRPVFLFRIDTDFSDRTAIDRLYEMAQDYNLKFTWFLHVEAHRDWISHFKKMENQEIALHGYEHATSDSFEKNTNNILSAARVLESEGIAYDGFCAPYGIWTSGLGRAIDKVGLKYSSEFTLSYDDLPFHALKQGKIFNHLQIPIHPVCTGSFKRKQASEDQMKDYFEEVIAQKIKLGEPVALYHHPMQGNWDVLKFIFDNIKNQNLLSMSFSEYADFWKGRNQHEIKIYVEAGRLMTESEENNIKVCYPGKSCEIKMNPSTDLKLEELDFVPMPEVKQIPITEFKKLKTAKLKEIKWSIQDRFRRHRL